MYGFVGNSALNRIDLLGLCDVIDDYLAQLDNQDFQREIVDHEMGAGYSDWDQKRIQTTLDAVDAVNEFAGMNQIVRGGEEMQNGQPINGAKDLLFGTVTLGTLVTPGTEGTSPASESIRPIAREAWKKGSQGFTKYVSR